jgi:hypothetical protein
MVAEGIGSSNLNVLAVADRYVVKGTLGADTLPSWPCNSEQEAFQKAAELFDEHGRQLRVEIFLNDRLPPLYGAELVAKWNQGRWSSN